MVKAKTPSQCEISDSKRIIQLFKTERNRGKRKTTERNRPQ